MKIGIITAMSMEHEQVVRLLNEKKEYTGGPFSFTVGEAGGNTLILMQCGIGKVNAAAGAVELISRFQPDCIVSTGVAGGIDSCLKVMDVVASSHIVYHDVWCGEGNEYGQVQGLPTFFTGNETLLQCANSLTPATEGMTIHNGLICSGDKFITDRAELDYIKGRFPEGLAVDMESGAIAQVCHLYQVPFISFRIISDTPGADEHWQQYTNFWETIAERSFGITHQFLHALPKEL
ncbi:MAG: 5'-methylthioadenosine/adenosylhomocysteine nucleosidase [Bacteroidaceae bacterium]|nr:5'-methylthioadenosine/adenosylhomocysteine nucleosidase [Bacteroidaceae bacterium]